jgi:hypothetical protein
MIMEIIQHRESKTSIFFCLEFERKGEKGCSYSFPCNEGGELEELNAAAYFNYQKCINNPDRYINKGVQKHSCLCITPRIGRCECGEEIYLDGFTNSCDCGRMYNWAGQELAPVSQWGEETGEHPSDILRIK